MDIPDNLMGTPRSSPLGQSGGGETSIVKDIAEVDSHEAVKSGSETETVKMLVPPIRGRITLQHADLGVIVDQTLWIFNDDFETGWAYHAERGAFRLELEAN